MRDETETLRRLIADGSTPSCAILMPTSSIGAISAIEVLLRLDLARIQVTSSST